MVASVGSISIDLVTNAAKFSSGFKASATTVEQQSSRMAKSIASIEKHTALAAGSLKTFVGGLAAGAGLAAIASLGGAFEKLKQTISEYDEIATNAKTTGLNSDTYQALAFAAKQANISQESYNSALNIFAKNAGLAATGQGALYSGLKKLNPELLQNILNTKDQEERLKLVADAMARTSDATQKAALSAAIFGKGGVEISRILEGGAASIDKLKKAAQDLGIIIPEDELRKAQDLDDKLDSLATVIHVKLGRALMELSPLLVSAGDDLGKAAGDLAHFSELVANFKTNPSLENFLKLVNDGAPKNSPTGLITGMIENYAKALAKFGEIFNEATTNTSDESAQAIAANIRYLQELLENLKQAAAEGQDVHLEIDDATAKLKALQAELVVTKAVGESAAKAISADFAQAFREAENASMIALAAMRAAAGTTNSNLPTVTRYGGDPNKITLPDQRYSYQSNANNSGVNVTRFGGIGATDQSIDDTADNTEETASNVDRLDRNTKAYFRSLSEDIGQYSEQQTQQQNIVINKLSDVTAQTFGMLSQSILAALVHNNDSGATGTGKTMFGDAWDPSVGSYISSWGIGRIQRPSYKLAPTSSDGTSDTSVNVQQPGTNITLNYNAAPGESQQTAKQNALAMFYKLQEAAASA